MRIRTAGRTESWIVEALQGSPIEIATSDLGTSLERGLMDSCFLSWSAILSFGVKDVTKYHVECNMYSRTWMIVMNKRVWDSLPPDLQKVLMDCSGPKNSAATARPMRRSRQALRMPSQGQTKQQANPLFILYPRMKLPTGKQPSCLCGTSGRRRWKPKNCLERPSLQISKV